MRSSTATILSGRAVTAMMRMITQATAGTRRLLITVACGALLVTLATRVTLANAASPPHAKLTLVKGVVMKGDKAFSGHLTEQYPDTRPKRNALYRNGRLHGVARGWYANGQLEYERMYSSGRETGVHRGWYENGGKRFAYTFQDGVPNGVQQEWFENGRTYSLFHYAGGHEQGAQQMWNADGTLRANYVIRSGRRYGLPGSTGCLGKSDSTSQAKS